MTPQTRSVLQAVRGNGFEVELRRGADEVHVRVIDPRRQAESSFCFDAVSELGVSLELARRYCSTNQRSAIFGETNEVAVNGPYRYMMA